MRYNLGMLDPHQVAFDFPILQRKVHGDKPLIYLDNAATSQKPQVVIDAISNYYAQHNANVHRGVHQLGDESTKIFHASRKTIANFFGTTPETLIVTRNTTEAVNLLAAAWGQQQIQAGDTIILSELEHHSNLVPWQRLVAAKNAEVWFLPVNNKGEFDLNAFDQKLASIKSVKLLALSHVSNTLGSVAPVLKLCKKLKTKFPDARVLLDGAQAAPHLPLNLSKWPVDFYVVSAHKMLGPMGIGGLFVCPSLIESLVPALVGGGMIDVVTLEKTTYAENLEDRFTAGTPDVASLAGWAAACEYLQQLRMSQVKEHDQQLVAYALEKLSEVPEVEILGPTDSTQRVGSVSFIYQGVHAHDVGQILDSEGIAVRSGHHCTMPLHTKFGWQASVRISFQIYNSIEDINAAITALSKVKTIFGK